MAAMQVVYLETVPPDVEAVVRACLPSELELRVRQADERVEDVLAGCDFVLVATTPLPAAAIALAPRLRLIQHQGVGYDKTDVSAATACGVPVALCPAGTSVGVAEHVFLLVLALYKQLLAADAALRQGQWLQWALRSRSFEIAGKCFGLVGFGRIGREVASRARAFGAQVAYFDPQRAAPEVEAAFAARWMPLEDLLAQADVLSLHLPLVPETRHLIGAAALARMRPTAILINTARGPLVDHDALVDALRLGRIAGAGLDVFEAEPLSVGHPLVALPNVVLTPHIAAGTTDALQAKMRACFDNMLRVARGEPPHDTVN
jgi:glyoxylate reductase